MNKIKVPKQELLDNEVLDDAIQDKIVGKSRWSDIHEIVFKWTDGKTYSVRYSRGSTEYQEERPWEYVDEVELTEVHQVEKTVKVWEPV